MSTRHTGGHDDPTPAGSRPRRRARRRPAGPAAALRRGRPLLATPGGSLETGEDHAAAALRELHEELGVDEKQVELGAQLAERSKDHTVGGREVRQVERYFLAYLTPADIDPAQATQPDNIRAHRWWTLDELRTTRETVYPPGLSDLITDVLAEVAHDPPIVLS